MKKIFFVVMFIFIGGLCIWTGLSLFTDILEPYDEDCLDSIARNICSVKGYWGGEVQSYPAGGVDNHNPVMKCYIDERSVNADTFKFTESEKEQCRR